MMYQRYKHIHFVGIGGIGMSGIAELLLILGYRVTGSDLRHSNITRRLVSLGAVIYEGHQASNIDGSNVVVVSSAIKKNNPEVLLARDRLIPVISRAEMLAELMRLKYGVAVAGAHGKTTTSSMLAAFLVAGKLDPTVIIGGEVFSLASNIRFGNGSFIVVEADESDGSFSYLSPAVVVITNIDREHMDYYGTDDVLDEAFVNFINKVPFYGVAVICLDNSRLNKLIPRLNRRIITYGVGSQADFQARDIFYDGHYQYFDFYIRGSFNSQVCLPFPGRHYVQNALGALAAAYEIGVDLDKAISACVNFTGVKRRFENKGRAKKSGALIIDDYAHHPTEISATLDAARSCWPNERLMVCFQPHRYTRTKDLFYQFIRCFYKADILLLLDIYAAGEEYDPTINARILAEAIRIHGYCQVKYLGKASIAKIYLQNFLQPDDIFFTMGAGDVWRLAEELVLGTEELVM